MTPDEAIAALRPWIARHERPCWFPIVVDDDGSTTASKLAGSPWLAADEPWPLCNDCGRPLQLFVQLNLDELPGELEGRYGTGLLQLFYCSWTGSGGDCTGEPGWEPFSTICSLVRAVQPVGESRSDPPPNRYPPKRIIGWERRIDLPAADEHDGIVVDYHFNDVPYVPTEIFCPELGLHFVGIQYANKVDEVVRPQRGEKLAGWPSWIHGAQYPSCPQCGRKMHFVFQIDSLENLPFEVGDAGAGYITQCPEHKDVVAYGWQCH